MDNPYLLSEMVSYSNKRVSAVSISIDNFVSTDNLRQNKQGLGRADTLPPQTDNMPAFMPENILVSNIRPYLKKIWFADREGGCSTDILVFDVNEEHEPKFVYYAILRDDFFNHMMRGSKGTKMPRGDKKHILGFKIPRFDKSTQQKISAVLSSLDAKIELNNKINAELEAMAKLIYDYWFVQFDFPDANGKPYKSSGGKMVYNEALKREIPEGWEDTLVNEVLAPSPKKEKILTKNYLDKGTIPIVNQSTPIFCGFTDNENARISADQPYIIFGDHTRAVKLVNFDFARGADGTQIICSNNDRIPQHLFYHTLLKIDLSNYGYARHFKFLKEQKILLPDIETATSFENFAEDIFKKIKHNQIETISLAELRDWLLPMLMNGQVTVEDA